MQTAALVPPSTLAPAFKRAARTFFQAFIGSLALLLPPPLLDFIQSVTSGGAGTDLDIGFFWSILLAAIFSGTIAVVTFAQNALEDVGAVRPMLKTYTPTKNNEVVDTNSPVAETVSPKDVDNGPLG